MQLSSDEALKFVSRASGNSSNGDRKWYRIAVTDNDGDIIQLYTDVNTFDRLAKYQTGDPLGLIIRAKSGQKGVSLTVTDIVG